ncbi:unnamed protein product, partial [Mesorhabditis spiculigera]
MDQPSSITEADDLNKQVITPDKCGPPSIPLSVLLDFAVQQILHEITVLSELVGKKYDQDKKISLVQFAHSTRTLTVKLLAIVRWLKTSKKFENCSVINYILDQQMQLFVETADNLFHFKNGLELAKLPNFHVCSAVDILTQGTYSRLPLSIKRRYISEPKITQLELANTLSRLNKVLQARISRLSPKLSPKIQKIIIKNGMVTLIVPGEFEAKLTVLGEAPSIPWTLLNIKMLVEEYEIGYGTQLVHPLQLNAVHQVLQSRMDASKNPLQEVYAFLHYFAQSIKLDVLFCQATQLASGRLRDKISIERYDQKERVLVIGYWLQRIQTRKGQPPRFVPQFRLQISCGRPDSYASLRVRHFPQSDKFGTLDERTGRLSMDRLLSEIFTFRCIQRLLIIREKLEECSSSSNLALAGNVVPVIRYRLVMDAKPEETLNISVNFYNGRITCTMHTLGERTELRELERVLHESKFTPTLLQKWVNRLKVLMMIERYKKAVACLQVRILTEAQMTTKLSKVESIPNDRIVLQFFKDENYYLIVAFEVDSMSHVQTNLHLLTAVNDKVTILNLSRDHPALHAPMTRYFELHRDDVYDEAKSDWGRSLSCAVAAVDDRIAFMKLTEELSRKKISYEPLQTEEVVGGLMLKLKDLQSSIDVEVPEFFNNLVRCCLRLDTRAKVVWPFECCIKDNPLPSDCVSSRPGPLRRACMMEIPSGHYSPNNDSVSTTILERLTIFAHIYKIASRFAPAYKAMYHKYCSIHAYTYHKLVIAYGEKRDQLLVLTYRLRNAGKPIEPSFVITFGQTLPNEVYQKQDFRWPSESRWNPHAQLTHIINENFNIRPDLVELVDYLVATSVPLTALSGYSRTRFKTIRSLASILGNDMVFSLQFKYNICPSDAYTMRLQFGHLHIEFKLLSKDKVGVRDCTRFHSSIVGMEQFWKWISNGTAEVVMDRNGPRNPSPIAPNSLPMEHNAASPLASSHSLSVPAAASQPSPHGSYIPSNSELGLSSNIILIDNATLHRACAIQPPDRDASFFSREKPRAPPLDVYLHGLVYLRHVATALSHISHLAGRSPMLIDQLTIHPDSIRVTSKTFDPPTPVYPHKSAVLNFNFYLCAQTFTVKCSIEYLDDSGPSREDIAIFEEFFERLVFPLQNEFALLAFLSICRMPNGAFASMAKVLRAQMDSIDDVPSVQENQWCLHLLLCVFVRENPQNPQHGRKFRPGVMADDRQKNLRLFVNFVPAHDPDHARKPKHIMILQYNMQSNQVDMHHQQQPAAHQFDDKEGFKEVFTSANEEAALTGGCPIWPAISQLLKRPGINRMPGSVQMPGSMMAPGSMDAPIGSVGNMGSVGPVGSVGTIGSVGPQQGGSAHNPMMI